MEVLENLFQQYLYIAKEVLEEKYSDQKYRVILYRGHPHQKKISYNIEGIILTLEEEYHNIINSSATKGVMPKDINQRMHVVTPCFVIALNRALKKESTFLISIDQVKSIMMDIFREFVGPLAEMQKNGLKNSADKWKKFTESTIFGTNNTYNSFDPEFIKNDENTLEFHLKKCVFFEVFKAHNELSLAPILCYYDDIFAEAVEEWITFIRPKTIADGNEYCQFCYNLKNS